jgi:hypothetical protein
MKKSMKQISSIVIGLFLFPFCGQAQQHVISIYGGGGLTNFQHRIAQQQLSFGGHLGVNYHYFFSPNIGIETGFEFAKYNAKLKADNLNSAHPAVDIQNGDPFEFRSVVNSYEEKLSANFIQLPIKLRYQFGKEQRYFVAGGFKVGIPLSAQYNSKAASFNNSGYYFKEEYEYTTQEFLGFGTFDGKASSGKQDFQTAVLASLEAGMRWTLNNNLSLYAGLYVDYGLNNVAKNASESLVLYNADKPAEFTLNSIANSHKTAPMAAGIKLRLSFNIQKMIIDFRTPPCYCHPNDYQSRRRP